MLVQALDHRPDRERGVVAVQQIDVDGATQRGDRGIEVGRDGGRRHPSDIALGVRALGEHHELVAHGGPVREPGADGLLRGAVVVHAGAVEDVPAEPDPLVEDVVRDDHRPEHEPRHPAPQRLESAVAVVSALHDLHDAQLSASVTL